MDWIARKRDWRQFFRLVDGLELGTAYYSQLLLDPEIALAQANSNAAPAKNPPLRGFTPLMHAITDLADILLKVNSPDPRKVDGLPRPLTARDHLKERKRARNHDEIVAKAMGRAAPQFDEQHRPIGGD